MQSLQPLSPWPARRCTLQRIRKAEGRRRVKARPADLPRFTSLPCTQPIIQALPAARFISLSPSHNAQHTTLQPLEAASSMTAERTENVRLHQVLTQRAVLCDSDSFSGRRHRLIRRAPQPKRRYELRKAGRQ